ncbi:MAG: orotidine-5'-phosphate decarboxylase [Turicibacter sp.]|nr:orotidine-5'-phosphate decarboxylase [Turicibacter sp.]
MTPEIIIAMDLPNKAAVEAFINKFPEGESLYLKVGMELYYKEGPAIVTYLKERGHRIFLDLKMHDIPNTVRSAMRSIASLGVDLTNLHAAGGKKMMEAAIEGLVEGTPEGQTRPQIIAVTQLTSTSKEVMNNEQGIPGEVAESALKWAKLSKEAGLDGVVCSVHEARSVHEACGEGFIALTPGIRLEGDDAHDQTRVATPKFGKEEGSTYLVLGRSITLAENPFEVYQKVQADIA